MLETTTGRLVSRISAVPAFAAGCVVTLSMSALAAQISLPHDFANGEIADAAEVNAKAASEFVRPEGLVARAVHAMVRAADRLFRESAARPAETGVEHNLTSSISHRAARDQRVGQDGMLSSPQLLIEISDDPDALAELATKVRRNASVFGVMVSTDERAALVRASYLESRIDYGALFKHVRALEWEVGHAVRLDVEERWAEAVTIVAGEAARGGIRAVRELTSVRVFVTCGAVIRHTAGMASGVVGSLVARMAGAASEVGVSTGQGERGLLSVIELPRHPVSRVVACVTARTESAAVGIVAGMTGLAALARVMERL